MSIYKSQTVEVDATVEFTDKEIVAAAEKLGMVDPRTLRPRDLIVALLEREDGIGRDEVVAEIRNECARLGIKWTP